MTPLRNDPFAWVVWGWTAVGILAAVICFFDPGIPLAFPITLLCIFLAGNAAMVALNYLFEWLWERREAR